MENEYCENARLCRPGLSRDSREKGKKKGRTEIKLNINTSPLNGRCKINKKTGRKQKRRSGVDVINVENRKNNAMEGMRAQKRTQSLESELKRAYLELYLHVLKAELREHEKGTGVVNIRRRKGKNWSIIIDNRPLNPTTNVNETFTMNVMNLQSLFTNSLPGKQAMQKKQWST